MFSKVLAGALGLAVVVGGGVVYHQYGGCPMAAMCKSHSDVSESAVKTSCCEGVAREDAAHACCSEEGPAVSAVTDDGAEVLAIAPREVK